MHVPWNEVVVLDNVVLTRSGSTAFVSRSLPFDVPKVTCQDHNFDVMKPVVMATWKNGFKVGFGQVL